MRHDTYPALPDAQVMIADKGCYSDEYRAALKPTTADARHIHGGNNTRRNRNMVGLMRPEPKLDRTRILPEICHY